jgi:hypothetical protein
MEKDYLVLKRASASRPSGEWNDDDYDVLADGVVVGRIMKAMAAPEGDARLWNAGPRPPRGPPRGTWSQFNPPDVHSEGCLPTLLVILSQARVQCYEQVVWMDADILINYRRAPNVFDDVPVEKVGAAEEFRFSGSPGCEMLHRMSEVWPQARPMIQYTPRDYYAAFGLPGDCDHAINTGVMVLSPLHQALSEKVYYQYEEKPGRGWHMEMRPLSYELNRAGLVREIDQRFNVLWLAQKFLHYPFLFRQSLKHKLCGFDRACTNVAFQRSYFFHLGGMHIADMRMIEA